MFRAIQLQADGRYSRAVPGVPGPGARHLRQKTRPEVPQSSPAAEAVGAECPSSLDVREMFHLQVMTDVPLYNSTLIFNF